METLMYQTYEQIKEQYPTHRFIFLTLTVKNPHITDLRSQLDIMNKAWKKLTKRKRVWHCGRLDKNNRGHTPQATKTQ